MIPQLHLNQERATDRTVNLPYISIVLPFEPTVVSKSRIALRLQRALEKVEQDIVNFFPKYMIGPAVKRLKALIYSLDYSVAQKSVAILLSPFTEKIYYLNIAVKETVLVGQPVNIRQLCQQQKEEKDYLVLSLNEYQPAIYLGGKNGFKMIVDLSVTQANKSSEDFLREVDHSLQYILNAYPFPLLLVGSEETLSLFKLKSVHAEEAVETVYCEEVLEEDVFSLISPLIENWQSIKEKYLLRQLAVAESHGKAIIGLPEILEAINERRTRLLIVEKDYVVPMYCSDEKQMIFGDAVPMNNSILLKDAVECAIEKVLADGGKVEMVNENVLSGYLHIGMITW